MLMESPGIATIADGPATTLSEKHARWLEARGIDAELAAKYGVRSSPERGVDWLAVPYVQNGVVVNHKYRNTREKAHCQDTGGVKCFWNVDCLSDQTLSGPVVITEGEWDALIAIQCGFPRTVSVPDGAPAKELDGDTAKYGYLDGVFKDEREIILAVDADGPGANLLHDLSIRIGKHRCKWVPYPKGCKDLNEAFQKYGARGVTESFARADWCKVDGVYRMSDLPPAPEPVVFPIGIAGLEPHYNIRLGDFCVITGIPSHGKTMFANEVSFRMADKGWVTVFASFEQKPQHDHRRNMRTYFNRKMVKFQNQEERDRADEWIDRHFRFLVPSEDDLVSLEWVLDRCKAAIVQHGARIVIIDPWNEMDHERPFDMSLTEYTGFAIKQFRKLATKFNVHVIVVAHPVKQRRLDDGTWGVPTLYDISDSAHWYNKADVGIVVHRENETETIIKIAKSRYHDQIGKPGAIKAIFDVNSNRFTVLEDQ